MASCGFQIFPRANVAQLGHCSSNELTGLKMMIICPLKSSGIALVAPCLSIGHGTLPEAKQIGRQTDVTELNAGALKPHSKCGMLHSASLLFWDVLMQNLHLKRRFGLNYEVEMQLQISNRSCDGGTFLIKCPGKEIAWENFVQTRLGVPIFGQSKISEQDLDQGIFQFMWWPQSLCWFLIYVSAETLRLFSHQTTCRVSVAPTIWTVCEICIGTLIADMIICKRFRTCSSWTTVALSYTGCSLI